MKQLIVISLAIFSCCRCTTKGPVEPTKPDFDFISSNYFSPTAINKFRWSEQCSVTPYWDRETVNLQGFLYSSNINAANKQFSIYDNVKVFDASNESVIVHFQSKDSAAILKAILDVNNKDKYCLINTACLTKETGIEGCLRLVQFTLTKSQDLEFK
jgi:hypothetical protein